MYYPLLLPNQKLGLRGKDYGIPREFWCWRELYRKKEAGKDGSLSDMAEPSIRKKIKSFLTPEKAKSHGRAIYAEQAKECGLEVGVKPLEDDAWSKIHELCYRINDGPTSVPDSKLTESGNSGFFRRSGRTK